jgi:hypothetical protein
VPSPWAQAKFKELGFDRVWTEPVTFPKWERRSESAQVLGASAQPLRLTALGGSPGGSVEAEVVRFADLAALEAAAPGSLAGKIAFIDYRMERARDGAGYGPGGKVRSRGPSAAIRAGAAGYLMRSAGTDSHRMPHTGITRFDEGLAPIPVGRTRGARRRPARAPARAWSGQAPHGAGLRMGRHLHVAERDWRDRGSKKPEEIVLIGGHLDSWDLGTGAIDDGAGVSLTMAAAKIIGDLKHRPARTIRVVAFANEEQGLHGGKAYAAQARAELGQAPDRRRERLRRRPHLCLFQLGARLRQGRRRADRAGAGATGHRVQRLARAAQVRTSAPSAEKGLAWARLAQDGTDYFDLHHTPDDTFRQDRPEGIGAERGRPMPVFAYLAASADGDFGSKPTTGHAACREVMLR